MVKGNSCIKFSGIIDPFIQDNLQSASYDLTIGELEEGKSHILRPNESILVSSKEKVDMPRNRAGIVIQRSSFFRMGILMGVGWIDPGYQGTITSRLFNLGSEIIDLRKIDTFAQMIILEVNGNTGSYDGHYQNSEGIAESAIL